MPKNFKGTGMSGYGGYTQNFLDYTASPAAATFVIEDTKIRITNVLALSKFLSIPGGAFVKPYKVMVTGLKGKTLKW